MLVKHVCEASSRHTLHQQTKDAIFLLTAKETDDVWMLKMPEDTRHRITTHIQDKQEKTMNIFKVTPATLQRKREREK